MKKIIICLIAIMPLLVSCEKQQPADATFLIGKWQWVEERYTAYLDDEVVESHYQDRRDCGAFYEFFADGRVDDYYYWDWSIDHDTYKLSEDGTKLTIIDGLGELRDQVYDIKRTGDNSFELIRIDEDGHIGANGEALRDEQINYYERVDVILE